LEILFGNRKNKELCILGHNDLVYIMPEFNPNLYIQAYPYNKNIQNDL